MSISKSVARKFVIVALMVTALLAVSFSVNASHIHANAAATFQVSVQNNQNRNQSVQKPQVNRFNRIYKVAKSKLGHKYVYGATGPNHFDCSGFTRYVYRKGIHKNLPRTAQAQYNSAKHVSKAHRQAGDLVFFGGSRHSISHVGMYVGHGKMIDAQNRGVVIEKVSAPWWHAVGYARPANLF